MQPRREVLSEYDYSVRVNLASSAICGGAQEPTVTLKFHLSQEASNSERQVRCFASGAHGYMGNYMQSFFSHACCCLRR